MDYEKLAAAIKLCGSTPKVYQCRECPYWAGGDMSQCIPCMTADAATAITDLLTRAEAAEARAEKAERERGAAVERLRADHWCDDCKYSHVSQACRNDGECSVCDSKCYCGGCENGNLWDWNGMEE